VVQWKDGADIETQALTLGLCVLSILPPYFSENDNVYFLRLLQGLNEML
jgi:hypothetical protein